MVRWDRAAESWGPSPIKDSPSPLAPVICHPSSSPPSSHISHKCLNTLPPPSDLSSYNTHTSSFHPSIRQSANPSIRQSAPSVLRRPPVTASLPVAAIHTVHRVVTKKNHVWKLQLLASGPDRPPMQKPVAGHRGATDAAAIAAALTERAVAR